ncbi:uncharacterized protein LOC111622643 [Centruroides sculpturatus]|uniref:uncharacterized protein LOC111622643 n=1 Tax=Centruroides sculpturatus TaxID=218467 RepID=UPI000C6DE46B|nr:uncharacterized protein LOC111622643 [Centruroides sculpturatus]
MSSIPIQLPEESPEPESERGRLYSEQAAEIRQERHRQQNKPPQYKVGDRVLLKEVVTPKGLKQKLAPRWSGPFRIIEILSPVNFRIENINTRRKLNVHADRIKPTTARKEYNLEPDIIVDQPSTLDASTGNNLPPVTHDQQALYTDPWDEFILSSIPTHLPEESPEPESESGKRRTRARNRYLRTRTRSRTGDYTPYALRSRGPVDDQPWVMPRPSRSRIPRFISPATRKPGNHYPGDKPYSKSGWFFPKLSCFS